VATTDRSWAGSGRDVDGSRGPDAPSAVDGGFSRWMQRLDSQAERRVLHVKYRTRICYTQADKTLMWECWRQGESLKRLLVRMHISCEGCPRGVVV
jgi:hypothetical protein